LVVVVQGGAVHEQLPFLEFLQAVDAADEGGLARSAGAAHHDDFSGRYMKIDIPEDMQFAEPFVDTVEFDHLFFPIPVIAVAKA
jgi:hypothetical protein